jgi:hypothetical protein
MRERGLLVAKVSEEGHRGLGNTTILCAICRDQEHPCHSFTCNKESGPLGVPWRVSFQRLKNDFAWAIMSVIGAACDS